MDHDPWEEINLEHLGDGRAVAQVNSCFREVAKNIKDPNKGARDKRVVTLIITFSPSADRRQADIEFKTKVKLAGNEPGADHMILFQNGTAALPTMRQEDLPLTETRLVPPEGTND